MPRRPTAQRYAQAAFQLALEHDSVERWSDDLELVARAAENEDFAALIGAPQVPRGVKHRGIETVLGGAGRLARNLLSVLVEHGQPRLARAIRDEYAALVDEHRGIARAEVVTAVPLEEAQRERVRALLTELVHAEVILAERVDPAIIGGVIARVGDRLIDGSTMTKLQDLRETLFRPSITASAESGHDA